MLRIWSRSYRDISFCKYNASLDLIKGGIVVRGLLITTGNRWVEDHVFTASLLLAEQVEATIDRGEHKK